jgi:penicillin-binding protein 1B
MRVRQTTAPPSDPVSRLLRSRRFHLFALAVLAVMLAGVVWLLWPYWQKAGEFHEQPTHQPSRLYATPTVLVVEEAFRPGEVVEELVAQGYAEAPAEEARRIAGTFHPGDGAMVVHLRRHPTRDGMLDAQVLEVGHNGRRVTSLTLDGRALPSAQLEPVLLATYFGEDLQERRPVGIDQVPEELIWAVLAAEDEGFFRHPGLSLSGIARAAWVNYQGGEVRQGGSTLTQQLVKNLYLTNERTLSRKAREAVLATLLEVRYTKKQILQAYLNEIYLGVSNNVSLVGVGAAARAYFGKTVEQLDLAEAATLAGMIQVPAEYMPTAEPEQSRERRDWVLDRMVEADFIDAEVAAQAKERPLGVHPLPVQRRRAPWFANHARREAAARFGVDELEGTGHQLLSTLSWRDQQKAQEAVKWGVEALEDGWEKGRKGEGGPLQAALVSLDPDDGGILAYVGGRDFSESQFDRAGDARRQAGSAFKPVVYAAAFEDGKAYPAAFIEDAPLTVRQAGSKPWTPRNSDGGYHGWVTVRQAVEKSLNVATARMALQEGLPRVVQVAQSLGIETPLEPVPAIALGAFEVTPLQLATVYATFASGGRRPPVHALEGVLDPYGTPLDGEPLPAPQRVISPETAYLITHVLQGVIDRGTGASARRQGVQGPLAGKTGTTNQRRDSWFSGYSPDRTTTVWVGYDDNRSTNLSGARAGVPIWSRFTVAVKPRGGYPTFSQPGGVATAVIDPTTGELATEYCPYTVTEVYPAGRVPGESCHVHDGWDRWRDYFDRRDERYEEDGDGYEDGGEQERRHPFRRWLNRVFGSDEGGEEEPREEAVRRSPGSYDYDRVGESRQGEEPPGRSPRWRGRELSSDPDGRDPAAGAPAPARPDDRRGRPGIRMEGEGDDVRIIEEDPDEAGDDGRMIGTEGPPEPPPEETGPDGGGGDGTSRPTEDQDYGGAGGAGGGGAGGGGAGGGGAGGGGGGADLG